MTKPKKTSLFPRLAILWSFIRPHKYKMILGFILGLFATAISLATPLVTKWVLDALAASQSLAEPIIALVLILVFGAVIWLWQGILLGTLAENIILKARESMIYRFFHATIGTVTKRPPGELVTRVTSDTVLLREAASSSILEIINGIILIIGTLILMSVLDLVLVATIIVTILVIVGLMALLMPAIAKAQKAAQESVGNLGAGLEGAMRAIKTVKVSNAEDRQAEAISAEAKESAKHGIKAVKTTVYVWTIVGTGFQLAFIVILGVGAIRINMGALEVSTLIAFMLYVFQLMDPMTRLAQHFAALQSGMAAAERIRELDSLEPEPVAAPEKDNKPADTTLPHVLSFTDVAAKYSIEGEPIVKGITFDIPRKGHVAIVGPSGAGKTTIFSLILRFLEPSTGEITLDGKPYYTYSPKQIREKLAYVEQETPVIPGTIRENLLYSSPDATDEEIAEVLREVRLDKKIASLEQGLDTPLSNAEVSGGQRQRIALARAILRTPEILLLDEATAQVDSLTEAAIHTAIQKRAEKGAVITIAHRLSTVIDADTIMVMEDGHIRARGTHQELLQKDELYRELVEALKIQEKEAKA